MAKMTLADLGDLHGKRVLVRVDFNVPLDKVTGDVKNDPPHPGGGADHPGAAQGRGVSHRHDAHRPAGEGHAGAEGSFDDGQGGRAVGQAARAAGQEGSRRGGRAGRHGGGASAAGGAGCWCWRTSASTPASRRTTPRLPTAIAALGDAYVNDAFGTCHNDKDASMVAVPAALKAAGKPRAVGLLVAKELEVIDGLMTEPKRPVLAIMGGAKGVRQDRLHQRPAGEGRSPADRRQDGLHVPESPRREHRQHPRRRRGDRRCRGRCWRTSAARSPCRWTTSPPSRTTC